MWTSVESSVIGSIGYVKGEQLLFIKFKSGAIFMYWLVPEKVHADFLVAESKGKFLNASVKPYYNYLNVSEVISTST